MKQFRRTFALLMALVLLCGMMPMGITAHASSYVNFTMEGFYDYDQAADMLAIMNDAREEAGLSPLELDSYLSISAMNRAAEYYVYSSPTRPDGTDLSYLLAAPFHSGTTVERSIICNDDDTPTIEWTSDTELYNPEYCTAGIGCFRQSNGKTAWVMLLSISDGPDSYFNQGSMPVTVYIRALPSNLGGQILHHYFSNALCACYLFEGLTIGTELQLLNINDTSVKITPSEINYSYTSSDDSVFSIDNEARTITAEAPGKATLSILVDGEPIRIAFNSADVEVWETPVLTYEKVDDEIHVNYADFPSTVDMYIRGTQDDMWFMGNREADLTYEHRNIDPTETYTYAMRYYDKWLDDWVVVGEPLVVQLGDKDPVLPEPLPTPTPDTDRVWLPTASDLPNRTAEPTVAEVTAELDRIFTDVYPAGTDWPYETTYIWNGGISFSPYEGDSNNTGRGTAGFAMALSDLIFGKLPAKLDYDMTVNDLRPGDIVITRDNDCYFILEATPLYIHVATTEDIAQGYLSESVKTLIFPYSYIDDRINYVLTRYTSASPGADVLHPSIVPADAQILDAYSDCAYINYVYTAVTQWTMTADGTLYLEGCGIPGYGDDSWIVYKDRIKKVVFGPGITGVLQDAFKGYKALEEVVLSDTVTQIRRSTFTNCANLKSIQFGKGLKTIEENAFQYSGLETLELPDSLESLGAYAFSSCTNLKTLYVPASITEWGNNVFTSCDALEELVLEDGLTKIGFSAFNHLNSLKTVNIPGSIKTIRQMAFYFSDIETLNIAKGVEVIEEEAFAYCKQLKEIHLPNTITDVLDNAFRDCDNVTDVYFYGTEAEWAEVSIGTSNDCLEGSWWSSTTIHFVDPNQCFHNNVTVLPAVAPTCTETGLTEGEVCADCGEVLTAQETIPSTNIHSYKDGCCTMCGEKAPEDIKNPFTDVSKADWYFNSVMWAVNAGVTGGKTAATFAPNEGCTRAQVVTFLWAANGKPEPKSSVNPFDDVADNAWYLKPVLWAVENGITGGISKHEFGPEQTCTRAQIVTFLYAAANKPPVTSGSSFLDVTDHDWYAKPVIWAAENDVTGGIGNGMFGPLNTCTRAQVVTFLYKVYG